MSTTQHSDVDKPLVSYVQLSSASHVTSAFSLQPRNGHLVPLRTNAEVEAQLSLVDAYIVRVPTKIANTALKAIERVLPPNSLIGLQHLRRIVKFESLPTSLRQKLEETKPDIGSDERDGLDNPASPSSEPKTVPPQSQPDLYLLACPTTLLTLADLETTLFKHLPSPFIFKTAIPSTPPRSAEEAKLWSDAYWSTGWKAHNAYGPQPSAVASAANLILPTVSTWLELARLAGQQCLEASVGENIGAVIVDPRGGDTQDGTEQTPVVVAAAGDARWASLSSNTTPSPVETTSSGNGNPLAHAVMRAIGLIGIQRVALDARTQSASQSSSAQPASSSVFYDQPLTPLESSILHTSPLQPGGYLCGGLEIYLTHEPCVMCSMAILHSRFDRVVFAQEMPETGGLCAARDEKLGDNKPGYGLFWLPGLNWRMLAWQWVEEGREPDANLLLHA